MVKVGMVSGTETGSPVLAALGIGIALASAPGPVQAVLLGESVRGGITRGLRALAGSSCTFGSVLVVLALGLSVARPSGTVLRALKVSGGVLLLWLAVDGFRSRYEMEGTSSDRRGLHPTARGALAIVLNPGAWLFLGAVASPLLLSATRVGGRGTAVLTALALMTGTGVGDFGVVVLGGLGLRRGGGRVILWTQRILATLLAGLGIWLLAQGIRS
jgi:threonine/homoserine/homoserine lactone efflux protein